MEELKNLLLLKEALRSPAFLGLLAEIDNNAVQRVFALIAEDAEEEREVLLELVRAWMDQEAREDGVRLEPSYRDIVTQWHALTLQAARRARRLADVAPAPATRMRLEALAARDEAHARLLGSLL